MGLKSNVRVWRKVLMDGYAALYASSFWPVLTVAMRALEVREVVSIRTNDGNLASTEILMRSIYYIYFRVGKQK